MSIDKLEEGLYVTDLNGLRDTLRLHQLGIKYVLNMAQSALYEESSSEEGVPLRHTLADFNLKTMELADHEAQDVSQHFQEIANFIQVLSSRRQLPTVAAAIATVAAAIATVAAAIATVSAAIAIVAAAIATVAAAITIAAATATW